MKLTVKQDWRADLDNIPHGIIRGILFSGDRFSCCDEAIVSSNSAGNFIGIVTIAAKGEDYAGQPDIVGLYVVPEHRRQKYGLGLLQAAIERCIDRGLKTPIRITIVSANMRGLYNNLPAHLKEKTEFLDCSLGLNLID